MRSPREGIVARLAGLLYRYIISSVGERHANAHARSVSIRPSMSVVRPRIAGIPWDPHTGESNHGCISTAHSPTGGKKNNPVPP